MPNPPFPPTSDARFRVPGEEYADGFVMDFDVTGSTFRIRLDLPKPADPGEAYLIFYASFYQEGARESMIETGLSVSHKGWNLLSKINGAKMTSPDCIFGPHDDPRDHAPVDVVVTFGAQHEAQHVAKDAAATKHGKADKALKVVTVSAAGESRVDHIPNFKPVGRMRLIIAAANNKHGHFDTAGISLQAVDNKQNSAVGSLVWMPGAKMTKAASRIVLIQQTGSGFVCQLPAADPSA